ncbi:MAG: DUF4093 domain-containing protein [Thermoflavifilum sp.]|nr:DUF4093 domain-containing protein [Thermoflavifilum sp.]MCL6513768.1 DUF4093 domain-containing protein [Alicyclobacillus sp.]
MSDRPRIREIIVVEGLHDRQAVDRAVEADVWVLGGDRIPRFRFSELRRAVSTRGVIILTDPDGPGERIRRRLADALPGAKHAFLPKQAAIGDGGRRLGVEFAPPEAIREAIAKARPTSTGTVEAVFTLADLATHGLAGGPGAAEQRRRLGEILGIGYANGQAFVKKLNALGITRGEWEAALAELAEVTGAQAGGADEGSPHEGDPHARTAADTGEGEA